MIRQERLNTVYISQEVIDEITSVIANQRPESGGLLMGPPDKDAITFFQYDEWGSKSGATYEPDAEKLSEIASELNRQKRYVIKGVVHSHPGSMSSLSFGDQQTIKKYFESNPGMRYFIAPIIYHDSNDRALLNAVRLNGRHCNSMAVHLIHWDELNSQDALRRTVLVKKITDLQSVPDSILPFNSNMSRNLTNREKTDLKEMRKKAPKANPEIFPDSIVWYELVREKGRRYKLCYWFDNDEHEYKAAIIEGLEPNKSLSPYISSDGIINIKSYSKNSCSKVVTARTIAKKAIKLEKPVKTWQILQILYTEFKELAPTLILGGILFVLLSNSRLFNQPGVQHSGSKNLEQVEVNKYFDNIDQLILREGSLTTQRDNTLLAVQGWTLRSLEKLNDKSEKSILRKEILLKLYDFQLIGYPTKSGDQCQIEPTINFRQANLKEAELSQQQLRCINLLGAYLNKTNFSHANLLNANLGFTDLNEANLRGANLRGANLRGAKSLTNEQIKSACNWKDAIYQVDKNQPNANQEFIEAIENDISSNPKQDIDCRKYQ